MFRLKEEEKHSKCTFVVTLSYSDEYLPLDDFGHAHLCKADVQGFIRKLRYEVGRERKLRYFFVGEYGPENLRPHYHGIIFFPDSYLTVDEFYMHAYNSWLKCEKFCLKPDICSGKAINYCSKYCMKLFPVPDYLTQPFALMSRKPGIGSAYLYNEDGTPKSDIFIWHKQDLKTWTYIEGGAKVSLPRYYQDKIFNRWHKDLIRFKFLRDNYPHALEVLEKRGSFEGSRYLLSEYESKQRLQLKYYIDKRKL